MKIKDLTLEEIKKILGYIVRGLFLLIVLLLPTFIGVFILEKCKVIEAY